MKTSQNLITLLKSILSNPSQRVELIKDFQQIVWSTPGSFADEGVWEIFGDLAHDLDFYEPNYEKRIEDPSFYDDQRLEEIVKKAINDVLTMTQS
jgi:hypothetical protein